MPSIGTETISTCVYALSRITSFGSATWGGGVWFAARCRWVFSGTYAAALAFKKRHNPCKNLMKDTNSRSK